MSLTLTEQSEPLNLCVGGEDVAEASTDDPRSGGSSGDDVVFVQEYKTANSSRGRKRRKTSESSPIRRNPVRRARGAKKFEGYATDDLSDVEEESGNAETESIAASVNNVQDSQDWTVKSMTRKSNIGRRRYFANTRNRGRRAKQENVGTTVASQDLQPLIDANMVLLMEFAKRVASCQVLVKKEIPAICEKMMKREDLAMGVRVMVRNQAILAGVIRNIEQVRSSGSIDSS